jgi:hypothetical protein
MLWAAYSWDPNNLALGQPNRHVRQTVSDADLYPPRVAPPGVRNA